MKAYTIHGMNTSDRGAAGMDRLAGVLREADIFEEVIELDYPWFGLGRAKMCNGSLALMVANLVEPNSAIFGHSNGAAIIYRASAQCQASFAYACLLNPALRSDLTIPQAAAVDTWYAPDDFPTLLARWSRGLIPSVWGAQGRTGYTGSNSKHSNRLLGDVGHSGVFEDEDLMRIIAVRAARMCGRLAPMSLRQE